MPLVDGNWLMLDSGAFSVWTQGASIDIEQYIAFCKAHPGVNYYVNLDVIAGVPTDPKSKTPQAMRDACEQGYRNYLRMIEELPQEKVIPVFHKSEDFIWLERYLELGASYIGIGQIHVFGGAYSKTYQPGDCEAFQLEWLREIGTRLFDSAGRPIVKTHGFAVTSFRLMQQFPWHSVDSASWVRQSAYGTVYVPKKRGGEFVYDEPPRPVNMSPKSPSKATRNQNICNLSPHYKAEVEEYLSSIRMKLGQFRIDDVESGYKLADGEIWYDKGKTQVIRPESPGVVTSHQHRFRANAIFLHRVNAALALDHIYFAGAEGSVDDSTEYRLRNRLMSFHKIGMCSDRTKGRACFNTWETLTDAYQQSLASV